MERTSCLRSIHIYIECVYIYVHIYSPVTLHTREMRTHPNRHPERNQPCHNAIWVNCGGERERREWDRCSRASSSINCKHTIRNILRAARLDRCPCGRGGGWSCGVVLTIPLRVEARACVGVCVSDRCHAEARIFRREPGKGKDSAHTIFC